MPPADRVRSLALTLTLLGLAGCAAAVDPQRPDGRLAGRPAASDEVQAQRSLDAARAALERGDGRSAAALFGEVAQIEPANDAAQLGLGEALLLLGRPDGAAAAFRRALDRAPQALASYGFGRAMLAASRPDAAVEELRAATAAAPEDPRFARALGMALDLSGRAAEAQSAYRAALARHPDDGPLRNNLGLSLALAGDLDEAIRILGQLAEGPRSSPRARQNLALAYGLAGDDEAAARLATIDLDAADVRGNLALFATLRLADAHPAALDREPAAGPAAASAVGAPPMLEELTFLRAAEPGDDPPRPSRAALAGSADPGASVPAPPRLVDEEDRAAVVGPESAPPSAAGPPRTVRTVRARADYR